MVVPNSSLPVTQMIDEKGAMATFGGLQEALPLVASGAVSPLQKAYGGDYQIRALASNWNGGSAKIQFLDADGSTYTDLANQDGSAVTPFTANRTQVAGFGSGAVIRAVVTGSPVGLFITATRMP